MRSKILTARRRQIKNILPEVNDEPQNAYSEVYFSWTLLLFPFLETVWPWHHIKAVWSHDLKSSDNYFSALISFKEGFLKIKY